MISIISNHYGVPLTRQVVLFPGNSTIAIEMLIDGIVDLAGPDFALGAPFDLSNVGMKEKMTAAVSYLPFQAYSETLFTQVVSSWASPGSESPSSPAFKLTAWPPSPCWIPLLSPPSQTSPLPPR
jgi:hypothetical protein